jgi:chromate transporter
MTQSPALSASPAVTCPDLFRGFFLVGISSFGGALPWARRMLVEDRGWLEPREFAELLNLCQLLPGPNVVNLSVCVGARYRGPFGAASALAGLMAMPLAIVLALAALIDRLGPQDILRHAFAGVTAAAAGLVFAMAVKTAQPLRRRWSAWAVCGAAFACVGLAHLPLLPVLAVLGPVGVLLAWRR